MAHARPTARRHQVVDRERAGVAQNRASDGFCDVGRVVISLHQTEEARLQIRRAGDCSVREPVVLDRLSECLSLDARVVGAENVVLVLPVAETGADDFAWPEVKADEVAGERKGQADQPLLDRVQRPAVEN